VLRCSVGRDVCQRGGSNKRPWTSARGSCGFVRKVIHKGHRQKKWGAGGFEAQMLQIMIGEADTIQG
jgi:hypothetical protein